MTFRLTVTRDETDIPRLTARRQKTAPPSSAFASRSSRCSYHSGVWRLTRLSLLLRVSDDSAATIRDEQNSVIRRPRRWRVRVQFSLPQKCRSSRRFVSEPPRIPPPLSKVDSRRRRSQSTSAHGFVDSMSRGGLEGACCSKKLRVAEFSPASSIRFATPCVNAVEYEVGIPRRAFNCISGNSMSTVTARNFRILRHSVD